MLQGWKASSSSEVTVRKHRADHLIALYTGIIMLIGLIVIYAIGPQRANVMNSVFGYEYSDTYFIIKQAISFALATGSFILFAALPYKWVFRYATTLLVLGLVACLVLAVAGWAGMDSIALTTNGATRWFVVPGFGTVQPAEFLKFGVLIYMAAFLAKRAKEGLVNDWNATLLPALVVSGLSLVIIVIIQKDLGTGISLAAIIVSIFFIAGLNKANLLKLGAVAVILGSLFIFTSPHRIDRVATYLKGDSTTTSDADSYHIQHAKIALGSGGLLGVGVGKSVQASGYLPEAINDSIFAIYGEMFGYVGSLVLIALFVALLMRILKVSEALVDLRLKFVAAGVFGWLGIHVILNIAAMIGIFPLTGITLSLMSYGGTSMLFVTAALGLVYQFSRYTIHESRLKEAKNEGISSRRGVGRTRHSSRSGA